MEIIPSASRVGIGCYTLSGAYGKKDPEDFRKMLERAVEEGITFFDTADTYGDEAEKTLGQALKDVRSGVWISTKVGIKKKDRPDLSRKAVKEACKSSLRNLQTDYIDLYLVHFDDPETPVDETVGTLDDLKKEGKIRHYGVSHLPQKRIENYCEIGEPLAIMAEFSAVSTQARKTVFPVCQEYGVRMIAFSVTGRGILTGRFDRKRGFEPDDIRRLDPLFQRDRLNYALAISSELKKLSAEVGVTRTQLAISWVLTHPQVWVALTGPSSVSHMLENIQAMEVKLSKDVVTRINSLISKEQALLRDRQIISVEHLLRTNLAEDTTRAFSDMIYVVETAVETGMISEEQVIGDILVLFRIKDQSKGEFRERLEFLRTRLQNLLNL